MAHLLNNSAKVLTIPTGRGDSTLSLDLTYVDLIEDRIDEVRRSNPMTLADLIVDFNVGMSKLGSLIGQVEYEVDSANQAKKMAEATALLERVDEVLKQKNQKSSTDTRQAAVDLDTEVQAARDRVHLLEATLKFLENKYSALERAYYSAKTVCDYQSVPLSANFGGSKK
jgi:hypothetical protein